MRRRTRLLLGVVASLIVTAAALGAVRLANANGSGLPAVGQVIPAAQRPVAPDISGTTLTGGHLDTGSWRGHVVVVNFWGSWCVPCREEAPVLARVARDTRFVGVRFPGIDIREDPFAGLAFEEDHSIPYPSISGTRRRPPPFGDQPGEQSYEQIMTAESAPPGFHRIFAWEANVFVSHPFLWWLPAAVELGIGTWLVLRPASRRALAASAGWALAVWAAGENFGGILTGSSTDVGAGPAWILLALAFWPAARTSVSRAGEPAPATAAARQDPVAG